MASSPSSELHPGIRSHGGAGEAGVLSCCKVIMLKLCFTIGSEVMVEQVRWRDRGLAVKVLCG